MKQKINFTFIVSNTEANLKNNEDIKNLPIGMFDSGIGGLTVLREIQRILPDESVIYIGDEAHFPYGEKSREQIVEYSLDICDKLIELGVKLIVIACNTITAAALDEISQHVNVPVVGVIDAGIQAALDATKNKSVGILATQATIDSQIFENKLSDSNSDLKITSVAAPKLVDFVQNDIDMVQNHPNDQLKAAIYEYCEPLKNANCDTVIMACTHFPPLEPLLQIELGAKTSLVSPSTKTAEEVAQILEELDLYSDTNAEYTLCTTGNDASALKAF